MLSTAEILATIEEKEAYDIRQLAKELEMPQKELKKILGDLIEHGLVEYNRKTQKVKIAPWLAEMNKEIENLKPTVGTIILPAKQEVKLQDIVIGNFTGNDLELNVKLKTRLKEIAICNVG